MHDRCGTKAKTTRRELGVTAFDDNDLQEKQYSHTDPIVITTMLGRAEVHIILVDNGSSVNILFKDAFDKMRLSMDVMSLHAIKGYMVLREKTSCP